MLLVRSGGIVGVVAALIVAGIFMLVVRPAINDTADRALDQAQQPSDDIRHTIAQATDTDDHLSATSFAPVVREIKAELGPDAELLDLTVTREGGGNVKYRTGDRAAGFAWGPGRDGLQPVEVTLVGSGKLADHVFPITKLSPAATTRLTAAVRAKAGAGFEPQAMTLAPDPVRGGVAWTVTGDADGRSLVFTARADGTGVKAVE